MAYAFGHIMSTFIPVWKPTHDPPKWLETQHSSICLVFYAKVGFEAQEMLSEVANSQ